MKAFPKSQRFLLLTVLLACALGAWISGELLKAHDDLWDRHETAGGMIGKLCAAGSKVGLNCSGSAHGKWSEITVPIPRRPVTVPTAFLGLAYFVTLGCWFLVVGGAKGVHRSWRLIPAIMTLGGLAGSAAMMALMIAGRAERCAPCFAVHGVNLLGVIAIWRFFAATQALDQREALESGYVAPVNGVSGRRLVAVALLGAAVGTLGLWTYRAEHLALQRQWQKLLPYKAMIGDLRQDKTFLLREFLAQEVHELTGRPGEVFDAARPRLVAFVDYECPNCGDSSLAIIQNARRAFGARLDVVIRHYPLCTDCNGEVKRSLHPRACEAAWAAEAALLQGGATAFEALHIRLMGYAGELDTEALRVLAGKAGLDLERFAQDMKGEEVRRAVAADVELARKWGVKGTPMFFLDGRKIDRRFEGPVYWETLANRDERGQTPTTQPAGSPSAATQPATAPSVAAGSPAVGNDPHPPTGGQP